MAAWTVDEAEDLAGRWAWDGTNFRDLTLAGADCPYCLHFPAFKDVILGDAPIGSSRMDTTGEEVKFPNSTPVSCKCGMHDKQGCGREGDIPVRPPKATEDADG